MIYLTKTVEDDNEAGLSTEVVKVLTDMDDMDKAS